METLKEKKRTKDIYEEISAYPKPPLIPIPGPNELETLEEMGIKLNPLSRAITKAAMAVTGFRSFQKKLPNKLEKLLRQTNLRGAGLFGLLLAVFQTISSQASWSQISTAVKFLKWGNIPTCSRPL